MQYLVALACFVAVGWAAPTVLVPQPVPVKSINQYAAVQPQYVQQPLVQQYVQQPLVQQYVQTLPAPVPVKSAYAYSAPYPVKSISYAAPLLEAQVPLAHVLAPVSTQYHAQDELGQYSYGYSNPDGHSKAEVKGIDGRVVGRYGYIDPNGKHVQVAYVADHDGFRVVANNLPVAPAVPELPEDVARAYSVERERYNAAKALADAAPDDDDDDDVRVVAVQQPVAVPVPQPAVYAVEQPLAVQQPIAIQQQYAVQQPLAVQQPVAVVQEVHRAPISPVPVPVPVPVREFPAVAPVKSSVSSYRVDSLAAVPAPLPIAAPLPPVKSSGYAYTVPAAVPVQAPIQLPVQQPLPIAARPIKSSAYSFSVPTPVQVNPSPVLVGPSPLAAQLPAKSAYTYAAPLPGKSIA